MPATASHICTGPLKGVKIGEDKVMADCNAEIPHSSSDVTHFGLIEEISHTEADGRGQEANCLYKMKSRRAISVIGYIVGQAKAFCFWSTPRAPIHPYSTQRDKAGEASHSRDHFSASFELRLGALMPTKSAEISSSYDRIQDGDSGDD